ncbi:MAG: extracellular solute-binding protein, partial [Anaerolineales bacterium]
MKKQLYVLAGILLAATMVLTACGGAATTAAPTMAAPTAAPATAMPAPTTAPATAAAPTATVPAGTALIRWSIGIGTGSDPSQVTIENDVANDFNQSHTNIHLVIEVLPNASARDTISTEIAAGDGPDIVGPVGWIGSNAFGDQWMDLAPYIAKTNYDMTKFDPAMAKSYQTGNGTLGLPFAVYPSAMYYNPALFTEAGVNPPPATYGTQYKMQDGSMVDWNWDTVAKVAQLLTIDKAGKHSGEAGFDKTNIVQYGFSFGDEGHPNYWGAYMSNGGSLLVPGGSKGSYAAKIPDEWKTAWAWVYNGMWGDAPYIPTGAVASSAAFDSGNVFASGKIAMLDQPSWYTCCLGDLTKAKGTFEFGAMPISLDGKTVAGRVDADSFRIWKGTKNPDAAFTVLTYLVDTGIQKLVVGTPKTPPAYGAVPGVAADRAPWLASQQAAFPFVKNWQTLLAGLNYPDVPSAEGYMPNINDAWARVQTFGDLLSNTSGVDLNAQEATLESDLTTIFN